MPKTFILSAGAACFMLFSGLAVGPALAATEADWALQRAVWRCQHDTERAGRSEAQWMRAYQRCIDRSEAGRPKPRGRKHSRS